MQRATTADTSDAPVRTGFPPDLDAKACQALNILLVMHQGVTGVLRESELIGLSAPLNMLIDCVYRDVVAETEVLGSDTLNGYHYVHPVRVAELAMLLARHSGADRLEAKALGVSSVLMNLGYVGLRTGLVEASGELQGTEWEEVRKHPELSAKMVAGAGLPTEAVQAILEHHEHWDGSGYPAGKAGDDISIEARIITICDAYVALCSRRPHREARSQREAIKFIIARSGKMFDPELATLLARQLRYDPDGAS